MLTSSLIATITDDLHQATGDAHSLLQQIPVGGGSINDAYRIETNKGCYFVKTNYAQQYPQLFETERKGLQLLMAAGGPSVPKVFATGTNGTEVYILMEWINAAPRIKNYQEHLGQSLASLHMHTSPHFGLDHDNYIGSLSQCNTPLISGTEFFIRRRLQPLAEIAHRNGLLDQTVLQQLDLLYKKLPDLLPDVKPSLLHGDLWNGNVITGADGAAWLVDPAVYYGYREADIAMMHLFGGFSSDCFDAYNAVYPLRGGWQARIDLMNLYPLLVHVVLFGGGYLQQMKQALHQYL